MSDPKSVPVDLRADGLLWLVNRALLHPRGYALGVGVADDGLHDFVLYGCGDEPWRYADEVDEQSLFNAVETLLAKARQENA
jgi:hypothetical protein